MSIPNSVNRMSSKFKCLVESKVVNVGGKQEEIRSMEKNNKDINARKIKAFEPKTAAETKSEFNSLAEII